ncbi:MAG: class I SAM-dependent methyltransferase [Solirubrobacteraceae bacterium]
MHAVPTPVVRSPPARGQRLPWMRSKNWDEHVENLEQMASTAGFHALRDTILDLASLRPDERVLDIGAGTGLLTLAAAPQVAHVTALDISSAMCHHLQSKLVQLGIGNVEVLVENATELPFGDASLDVVISNYCLHHLADTDKRGALAEIERVLRPGGRLVFADMMFQLSVIDRRDRAVIGKLVKRMLNRGPAGLLRIARNATRIATGRWEHPTRVQWWQEALLLAGFVDVAVRALDHEGGIASARKAD